MSEVLLKMQDIVKEFSGVKALDQVNLTVEKGAIHALVGENGAGKSTLMNVLSGIYPHGSYSGDIFYQGKEVQFKTIRDSETLGVVIIHQELALIPELSIYENIFVGHEKQKNGVIDWDQQKDETKKIAESSFS